MAEIIIGLGASHTPLLTLTTDQWERRSEVDYANTQLNHSDGRLVSYEELLEEVGPKFVHIATIENYKVAAQACDDALEFMSNQLASAKPDLVIIIGDDQRELFTASNQPAIAIYHSKYLTTSTKYADPSRPLWAKQMGQGYMMDDQYKIKSNPEFALELIHGLVDENFDISSCSESNLSNHLGIGHAYGFIVKHLIKNEHIPIIPILLNTYYSPNVPSANRCYQLGEALQRVINKSKSNAKIAIIASGGLSHFIVDEILDQNIFQAFKEKKHEWLRNIPRGALNSGSSEILNWIVTAASVNHFSLSWHQYYPIYRTPAGTGVGTAFAIWKP